MMEKKIPCIDIEECAGCSVCAENCPNDCLAIKKPDFNGDINNYVEMVDKDRCIGCGICERVCPIGAIHLEKVQ